MPKFKLAIDNLITTIADMARPTSSETSYSSCSMFSSSESVCPLCRARIPALTPHRCEQRRERKGRKRR